MGWAFVMANNAFVLVPLFQILLTGSNGAFNMAAVNIQYIHGPESGKTTYLGVTPIYRLCYRILWRNFGSSSFSAA
jgi:hypothetical protein